MKKTLFIYLAAFFLTQTIALTDILYAKNVTIVTTYPYIASIAKKITGNKAQVTALAAPQFDPHFIVPKPSFIAKLRDADLFIINGAQLEVGWVPPLIRQANNPDIISGSKGFLDLSKHIIKINIPHTLTRAHGDVHPEGNPHFHLDPANIPIIAKVIYERLCAIVPEYKNEFYLHYNAFITQWQSKLSEWDTAMQKVNAQSVIAHHRLFDYFFKRYTITLAGTIEPLPGISPTPKHIASLGMLMPTVSFIITDVYHPDDAARYLSQRYSKPLILLPHDVGATPDAGDIFLLFDAIVRRMTQ